MVSFVIISFIILLIAVPVSSLTAQTPEYPVKIIDNQKFYEYTVQAREGFFRLKVKFRVTEEEIKLYNPEAREGLQVGMKLLIPVYDANGNVEKGVPEQKFKEHIVERKQTLFRIRKLYSISEEEILKHNPQLRNRSLQEGDVLKIPLPHDTSTAPTSETAIVSQKKQKETAGQATFDSPVRMHKRHFRIAFLLPFMLDQKHESTDSRFVEFYTGALLAINEAKARGRTIEVFTFDTEKSDLKVMEILHDTLFNNIDLIVGPAYSNQVPLVCDFARIRRIKTLIPFTSKVVGLESNEYIYQFNPGMDTEINKLVEVLTTGTKSSNIIFIENPYVAYNDEGNQLVAQLKVLLRNNKTDFKSLSIDPSNTTALRPALNTAGENILIFNTNRIGTLTAQMRHLIQLSDSFQLKIYEPYSWKTNKVEKPASFYLSAFRNEYPDKQYEVYMQKFDSIFGWLPVTENPRYDLLGFDLLSYYFSTADLPATTRAGQYPKFEGIQSTIQFEKSTDKSGYINKQLNHFE
jgi:LysM repeat protein